MGSESERPVLEDIFDLVDQHLLALAIEGDFGPEDQDPLQGILRESLLFAQLEARPLDGVTADAAQRILAARMRWVFRRVPQATSRNQTDTGRFSLCSLRPPVFC